MVNAHGTSTVWDDLFETDEQAFQAFTLTVETEGMEAFLDDEEGREPPTVH